MKKSKKQVNIVQIQSEKPEKNFSGKNALTSLPSVGTPKRNNFPATGPRNHYVKILPSHRAIFENYKDNGFRLLGNAIRKTGNYSENVAKRVNIITKSQSWQALMLEYMPEEHIAIRHAEILDKRDRRKVERLDEDGNVVVDEKGNAIMDEVDDGPNTAAVTKGLELAYRLRGKFKTEEVVPASTVMYNLFYKPEVRHQMRVFEDGLKEALINEISSKNKKDIEEKEERDRAGIDTGRIIDAETED